MTHLPFKTYQLSPEVHLLDQDGFTQLLDFRQGQFYALDSTASEMLSLVLEKGFEITVKEMTQTYDVMEESVRQDLNQFLRDLEQKNLIFSHDKPSNHSNFREHQQLIGKYLLKFSKSCFYLMRKAFNPQPFPNRLTVDFLLILSGLSFRLLGWDQTLHLWQQWHTIGNTINPAKTPEILQTVDQLVRKAAASQLFLPLVCKERALVGYHLLKTFYGLPTTLVIGIDPYPLQIHAWVECEGVIITDDAAHCQLFSPLLHYA